MRHWLQPIIISMTNLMVFFCLVYLYSLYSVYCIPAQMFFLLLWGFAQRKGIHRRRKALSLLYLYSVENVWSFYFMRVDRNHWKKCMLIYVCSCSGIGFQCTNQTNGICSRKRKSPYQFPFHQIAPESELHTVPIAPRSAA